MITLKKQVIVDTFVRGDSDTIAEKVKEEGGEVLEAFESYAYSLCLTDAETRFQAEGELMLEIGDVITAAMNLCESLGFDAQECVDLVQTKNVIRGYYDSEE